MKHYEPVNFEVAIEFIGADDILDLFYADLIQAAVASPFEPSNTQFAPVNEQNKEYS